MWGPRCILRTDYGHAAGRHHTAGSNEIVCLKKAYTDEAIRLNRRNRRLDAGKEICCSNEQMLGRGKENVPAERCVKVKFVSSAEKYSISIIVFKRGSS